MFQYLLLCSIGNSDIIIQPELEYLCNNMSFLLARGNSLGNAQKSGCFYGKISLTHEGQASNVIRNLGSEFADYDIPTGCSFKLAC